MAISEAKKRANAKYQAKTIASLACRVKIEEADQFKALCAAAGKTSNAVLKEFVYACLGAHSCSIEGDIPAPAPAQSAPVDGLAVEAFQEDLDKMRDHLEVFGLNEKKFLRRAIYKQILMDRKTNGFNAPIDEDDENAMNLVNRV